MAARKSKTAPPAQDALTAIREAKNEIVVALIQQAKRGSYLHAKFLFEFAGITDAGDEAADNFSEDALVKFFVEQLRIEEPEAAAGEENFPPPAPSASS